jgi:hypothetical protein
MAKTITIFLKDGDADGIIKTSISNSSILCYKIPRDRLDAAKEIPHLSYTGVYFLFGNGKVYVGQAGYRKNGYAIFTRLSEHDKSPEKEFWTEAVVFTKTEDTLGSTEISYLEHRFYNLSLSANRFEVKNGNDPSPGNITEEKKCEMDEYAANVELILNVLGYKVFSPIEKSKADLSKKGSIHTPAPTTPATTTVAPINRTKPALPVRSADTKIGTWIRTAMRNLSESGYTFTAHQIEEMTTSEWSKQVFRTGKPFMRIYTGTNTSINDENGYPRFWNEPFNFGAYRVLVSKEWYKQDFQKFENWYNSL